MLIRRSTQKTRTAKRKGRSRKGEGSLRLRGDTWWYRIPNPEGGKPIEKSCETGDYQKAIGIKNAKLLSINSPRARAALLTQDITIRSVLDEYLAYAEAERQRSIIAIRAAVKSLKASLGTIPANDLTTLDGDRYRRALLAKGREDSTANRHLSYLKAALGRLTKETPPRLGAVPFLRFTSEKDNVREGFIERPAYKRILEELPAPLQAIFVVAFHTGTRSGELKSITWDQVKWEQGIIELRAKKNKNGDGRWLPIWGDMREYLLRQKEIRDRDFPDCPWVFFWFGPQTGCAPHGAPLRSFNNSWDLAVARAGFPDLLFHDLRRSAIKYAEQEAGMSPKLVRMMSGHRSESVYNRYNIADGRDVMKLGQMLDNFIRQQNSVVEITRKSA